MTNYTRWVGVRIPVVITLGGVIGYLFPSKPYGYDVALIIPGILGALSGYAAGSYCLARKDMPTWLRVGSAVLLIGLTIAANQIYLNLVGRGGVPRWYGLAIYATFFVQVALFFAFSGLLGIGLPSGKGDVDENGD